MSGEVLLSGIIPFAGSGLGNDIGFALRKMLKWILIIVGFLAGMFFVGIQLLQKYGYVSTVKDKLGNDTSLQILHCPLQGYQRKLTYIVYYGLPTKINSKRR
jgi:uncharacterized membrane protein (Fun14 family)